MIYIGITFFWKSRLTVQQYFSLSTSNCPSISLLTRIVMSVQRCVFEFIILIGRIIFLFFFTSFFGSIQEHRPSCSILQYCYFLTMHHSYLGYYRNEVSQLSFWLILSFYSYWVWSTWMKQPYFDWSIEV